MSALDLSEESVRSESPEKLGQLGEALVLLVDSDPSSAEFMARALTQSEMRVVISDRISGAGGASMQLRSHPEIGVVVIDPQTVPGRDNLTELREAGLAEDVQVILVAELSRRAGDPRPICSVGERRSCRLPSQARRS